MIPRRNPGNFFYMLILNLLNKYWPLLAAAFLAILQGYHYGIGDLATYVPFVWHHIDPQYFSGDLLTRTLGDHPVYIWHLVAFLARLMDIQTVFFVLFIAQVLLLAMAYRYFFRTFFSTGDPGWIVMLLILVTPINAAAMGRYGLNPYLYFHPGALAQAALLFGYCLLDRDRWLAGSAVLGAIFLFHPFTALYGALLLGFRILIDFRHQPLSLLLMSMALFLLVSAPSWGPFLYHKIGAGEIAFDKALWLELVRGRMKFSFFISQWIPDRFIHLLLASAGILAYHRHPAFRRLLPVLLTVATALLVMALGDLFSIKFILQLQLARNSFLLFPVIAGLVIHHIMHMPPGQLRSWRALLLLVPLILMLQTPVGDKTNPARWLLLSMALLGTIWIVWQAMPHWRRFYVGLIWALALVMCGTLVVNRLTETGRFVDETATSPWEQLQIFCERELPVDAVVMTPIHREGFRSLSKRSIFGSFKDGAPHNYSNKTIFEWWERMQALGVTLPFRRDRFPGLYRENAEKVARQNGIRYVVYERGSQSPDESWEGILYENEGFRIVDLDALNPGKEKDADQVDE